MQTKICSKCGVEKPLTEYHKNGFDKNGKQKYRGYCKACANALESARYRKKKEFINSLKTPCLKCGENRVYVLDFHHIDETQKEFTIGKLKKGSKEILQNEINKCITLCSNCHREFHYLHSNFGISLEDYLNGNIEGCSLIGESNRL